MIEDTILLVSVVIAWVFIVMYYLRHYDFALELVGIRN